MFVIEIRDGELLSAIEDAVREKGISDAAIVTLIGAVDSFTLSTMPAGDATRHILTDYGQPAEMTATGEIVDGKPHIHAVMAVEGTGASRAPRRAAPPGWPGLRGLRRRARPRVGLQVADKQAQPAVPGGRRRQFQPPDLRPHGAQLGQQRILSHGRSPGPAGRRGQLAGGGARDRRPGDAEDRPPGAGDGIGREMTMASDEQMQRLASELETVGRQLGNIEDSLDRMTG